MSTIEETNTILETTVIETADEVTQVTNLSSETVITSTEENPVKTLEDKVSDDSTNPQVSEASPPTNTNNQSTSENVDLPEETSPLTEEKASTNPSEETKQTAEQQPVNTQESEKGDLVEDKVEDKPLEENENIIPVNGAEEVDHSKNAPNEEPGNVETNPVEPREPETKLSNGESKGTTDEENTDDVSPNKKKVEEVPMDVDQDEDKTLATEPEPEQAEVSDDEVPEEGVYIVEAVVAHRKRAGKIQYFLKWKGYPDTDNTWEDEDNLFCTELIEDYWKTKKQDTPVKTPVKRNKSIKRKSEEAEEIPKKKQKEVHENNGDEDNWEDEVKEVETVEKTKDQLMIYLLWKNGKRSVHPSDEVNQKCPQKVISFYESHLSFKASS